MFYKFTNSTTYKNTQVQYSQSTQRIIFWRVEVEISDYFNFLKQTKYLHTKIIFSFDAFFSFGSGPLILQQTSSDVSRLELPCTTWRRYHGQRIYGRPFIPITLPPSSRGFQDELGLKLRCRFKVHIYLLPTYDIKFWIYQIYP